MLPLFVRVVYPVREAVERESREGDVEDRPRKSPVDVDPNAAPLLTGLQPKPD